ncbi:hypothetical protein CEUSTIGMA_g10088.t1 [Chlamydomonas eustigma]|uniref:alpha-1,2-Mannosidase n=1 Tax=Chlamydomonas eustigma TaxID=1157962 RepID=A0A250XIC4_9CHLO|nr:hypothetical protein CEUSTIGMA_g10088.t1 [Chlamydomonas eustigma]|eukprot:GAX82662.1 hypothetical protein CEUSTIGMA_g10088.t1 [Chlamydomonas eustigma]
MSPISQTFLLLFLLIFKAYKCSDLKSSLKDIWNNDRSFDKHALEQLREEAQDMFDFGFGSYMRHAFPQDNLLPQSCKGKDWQGGIAVTLVDVLDTLLLMGRRKDMQIAVELLRSHLNFEKDIKVHVFETIIRVLGGLISGHMLLTRNPTLIPDYDGVLLDLAVNLTDRMLPAFDTPSGMPSLFVNLKTGGTENNVTCTACAGTLLLEFGLLSALTRDPKYMDIAHKCAKIIYAKRSKLGLVGSSFDISRDDWSSRETTIGPGIDSYYEYLLKAYLMFGDEEYLEMFLEVYTSTMQYLQLPINVRSYSFLVDVNMDSGRLSHPFVSSLGAFWPGMQALAGQEQEAVELHANYTAAWRTFGWMPEVFHLDLTLNKVHPNDPGYNLRPEHVESTFMLHSLTGNPEYLDIAAKMQETLVKHNKAKCGFASITHVDTGEQQDLQESFFLSETLKYLFFIFSNQPHFIDYYVLTTEGHLMPVLLDPPPRTHEAHNYSLIESSLLSDQSTGQPQGESNHEEDEQKASDEPPNIAVGSVEGALPFSYTADLPRSLLAPSPPHDEAGNHEASAEMYPKLEPESPVPSNCEKICTFPDPDAQVMIEQGLKEAFPLIHFERYESEVLMSRRCKACIAVTLKVQSQPRLSIASRARIMKLPPLDANGSLTVPMGPQILAQVVCTVMVLRDGSIICNQLRPVTTHDLQHGVPINAVVLQLSLPEPALYPEAEAAPASAPSESLGLSALVVVSGGLGNSASLYLPASPALFGPKLSDPTLSCVQHLLQTSSSRSSAKTGCSSDSTSACNSHNHVCDGHNEESTIALDREHPQRGPSVVENAGGGRRCGEKSLGPFCHSDATTYPGLEELSEDNLDMTSSPACGGEQQNIACGQESAHLGLMSQSGTIFDELESLIPRLSGHGQATPGFKLSQNCPDKGTCLGCYCWYLRSEPYFCCGHEKYLWSETPAQNATRMTGPCKRFPVARAPITLIDSPHTGCESLVEDEDEGWEASAVTGVDDEDEYEDVDDRPLVGRIAVVMRGGCSFVQKVLNMQAAGAVGVIVINGALDDGGAYSMSKDSTNRNPSIPSVLISRASGQLLLRSLLQNANSKIHIWASLIAAPRSRSAAKRGRPLSVSKPAPPANAHEQQHGGTTSPSKASRPKSTGLVEDQSQTGHGPRKDVTTSHVEGSVEIATPQESPLQDLNNESAEGSEAPAFIGELQTVGSETKSGLKDPLSSIEGQDVSMPSQLDAGPLSEARLTGDSLSSGQLSSTRAEGCIEDLDLCLELERDGPIAGGKSKGGTQSGGSSSEGHIKFGGDTQSEHSSAKSQADGGYAQNGEDSRAGDEVAEQSKKGLMEGPMEGTMEGTVEGTMGGTVEGTMGGTVEGTVGGTVEGTVAMSTNSGEAKDVDAVASLQEAKPENNGAPLSSEYAEQVDEINKDPRPGAPENPYPTPPLQPRLDMLIPTSSHAFVIANLVHRGIDLNTLFSLLLQDGRAVTLMSNMAKDSLERAGLSSASAEVLPSSFTSNVRKTSRKESRPHN